MTTAPFDPLATRPLTWEEGIAQYAPARARPWAERNMHHLPLTVALMMFALMAMFIRSSTAFLDEALYVKTGYGYLNYWLHGTPYTDLESSISGVAMLYPVFAAMLDSIGGLWLVRTASTVLVGVIIVLTARMVTHLVTYRAGVFTAFGLALTAPVIFLGQHATHDALSLTLIVGALYLSVTKTSARSAVAVGGLLSGAMAVKYTGAVFAPPVLVLLALTSTSRGMRRTFIALATMVALLIGGYFVVSDAIIEGLARTTFSREDGLFGVIAPTTTANLARLALGHLGPLLVGAAIGGVALLRHWRWALVAMVLVGTAALLPLSHMVLGELSSFEKHLGWSAVFLAPLFGYGLDRLSRTPFVMAPPILLLVAMLVIADGRAAIMVYWTEVDPVIEVVEESPVPGEYLAMSATALDYHTRDAGYDITWTETFNFWNPATGEAWRQDIIDAVNGERFSRVILRDGDTGNDNQNAAQQVLRGTLNANSHFEAERVGAWTIYSQVVDHEERAGTTSNSEMTR